MVIPVGDARPTRRLSFGLLAGIIGALIIAVIAIVAPLLWGASSERSTGLIRSGASAQHWLGTDGEGRDVLLLTLVATRLTVMMALGATAIAAIAGGVVGGAVGVLGSRVQWVTTRAIDLWTTLPPIVMALAIIAIFSPGTLTVVLAVGIAFIPQFARLAQTLAIDTRQRDYVVTAHLLGVPRRLVLIRHILPNILGPLLVLTSVCISTVILTMAGLSLIGLGVQPPSVDWGQLLASGLANIYQNPITLVGPAVAIILTGLCASLVGDGLVARSEPRHAATPRRRRVLKNAPLPPALHRTTAEDDSESTGAVLNIANLEVSVGALDGPKLVAGISMVVRSGEIVGVVGESGSGKSITAMAAAGLTPPELRWSASTLHVAGHPLTEGERPPVSLALNLGVVFQDPSTCFNPARKLGPQLTESIRVHRGISKREANALAVQKLREARVSAPEVRMRQYPHELSGGMRQRAMIAMALLTSPRLLIADEPTTALDVTVQADVLRLIHQASVNHTMAVLLISHDIDVIAAMCTRVYVMRNGQVVEHLTAAQLRTGDVNHPYTQMLLQASATSSFSRAVSHGVGSLVQK